MKLYAFQPDGHGEQSFFVMAESEHEAKGFVDAYIEANNPDCDRWGTDYYKMTVLDRGEVIENDNL